MYDEDEDEDGPTFNAEEAQVEEAPSSDPHFDISDIGEEALRLLGDYVPRSFTDKAKAQAWAAEQVRLLMIADAANDREFLSNYPRALILLAKAEGVEIVRGKERLLQDRFLIIGRLILRILTKI